MSLSRRFNLLSPNLFELHRLLLPSQLRASTNQISTVQGDQSQVTQSVKNIQPAASAFQAPAPTISAPVESHHSVMPQAVRVTPPVTSKSVVNIQPAQPVPQKPTVNNNKVPGEEVKRSGWNCDASGKDENWNCQLVGADPKGKAEAVATNDSSWRLLTPAFDHQQEQTFSTLTAQD